MECSKIVKKMAFTVSGFSEAKVMSSIGLFRLTNRRYSIYCHKCQRKTRTSLYFTFLLELINQWIQFLSINLLQLYTKHLSIVTCFENQLQMNSLDFFEGVGEI